MSHLAEEYGKSLGVRMGKPFLNPHFIPIPCERFITIHNDKKVPAKRYSLWKEVVELLKTRLGDIKIIQIGAKGEEKIDCVDYHLPTDTLKQCSYIISKSLCHVGIDSVPVHIASALDKPIVSIYSHIYPSIARPLWNKKSPYKTLESHRNGNKPSYSMEENPQTINFIKPEEIANSVLDILNLPKINGFSTLYVGEFFQKDCVDIVPIGYVPFKAENINFRMDLHFDEDALFECLQSNGCEITTSQTLSEKILDSKNIRHINYFTDTFDVDFIKKMEKRGLKMTLLCPIKENLPKERKKLFDHKIHFFSEEDLIEKNKLKFNHKLDGIKIRSSKKIVIGNKVFESKFDAFGRKNPDDFFVDLEWLFVYDIKNEC
jgi:hypothetical protein